MPEVELPAAPYNVDAKIQDKAREVIAAEHELEAFGLRGALADMQSAEPAAWLRGYRRLAGRLRELEQQSELRGERRIRRALPWALAITAIGSAAGGALAALALFL